MLLLYTDGVTEAESAAGEMYEENRLIRFARDHHTLQADRFAEELMADVAKFSGRSELSDDLTLIALRKR